MKIPSMPPHRVCCLLCFGLLATTAAIAGPPLRVLIVAGQSNVLNWHAAAAAIPPDPADSGILFWHVSGAPPSRGLAVPVNATSDGRWTTLGAQRQEPFVRYERDFFGPEITLGRALQRDGEAPVAIIKVGFFGTALATDWRPAATEGDRLYARLLAEVAAARSALAGRPHEIDGFFWMQGETDANREDHARAYPENLRNLITALRRDLRAPDLPFILGRIGPPPPRGYAHQEVVRAAQSAAPGLAPAVAVVDTDDLPRDTDGVHLLADGVLALGRRWAEAWGQLRSPQESSDNPSPPRPARPRSPLHDPALGR